MAIGILKSNNVTALESKPISQTALVNGKVFVDKVAVPVTSSDDVGDIILLNPIPSNAKILRLGILNDSLAGSGLTYNIGLYYSGIGGNQVKDGRTSGQVIDADCIGTAVAFSSARLILGDVRFEAADITSIDKEAWELAGLTADCGGTFYIGLTCAVVATTPAAGDIVSVVELL